MGARSVDAYDMDHPFLNLCFEKVLTVCESLFDGRHHLFRGFFWLKAGRARFLF